jgi:hypothetical protein
MVKIWNKIGAYSFVVGLVLALIAAFVTPNSTNNNIFWFLGIVGLIIGFLNISDKEINLYLISSITWLLIYLSFNNIFGNVYFLTSLITYIVIFVAPGAAIISLKALYNISK